MTKLKQPLLSLDARGSLGDVICFQRGEPHTIVRAKPIPLYRRTLSQQYQRWDYRDGIVLWSELSDADKRLWATAGSKLHLTAYAAFMRNHLRKLPILMGRWRLDEPGGIVARDSSKQGNHGTIYGALPALGPIGGCRYFDGIDDYIEATNNNSLRITSAITMSALFMVPSGPGNYGFLIHKGDTSGNGYGLFIRQNADRWDCYLRGVGDSRFSKTGIAMPQGEWFRFTVTWDGSVVRLYKNADQIYQENATGTITQHPNKLRIGRTCDNLYPILARIDDMLVLNEPLSAAHVEELSERRYP